MALHTPDHNTQETKKKKKKKLDIEKDAKAPVIERIEITLKNRIMG